MESERETLREELRETTYTLTEQLTHSNTQLLQAREVITELEEELEATRNKAHLHSMALNTEITDSILASGKLSEKLMFLHEQLQASVSGMQVEKGEAEKTQQQVEYAANLESLD